MVGMLEQATNLARTLKESFCNIPTHLNLYRI